MISFIKNWLGKETTNTAEIKEDIKEESVLSAADIPSETQPESAQPDQDQLKDTPLSLHPLWEEQLNAQQKYALSFMVADLPPIAVDNVALAGLRLLPHEAGIEVTAFVRNGLPRPIRFEKMNLLVLIGDNELFSRQEFDMDEIGEIPPFHARPWSFVFKRENFLKTDVLLNNWKLAFELAQKKMVLPQQLELEESWIKALSDEQKNGLIRLAQTLPPIKPGEVNVQSVQVSKAADDSLRALLLIRNGANQALSFESLPLALFDANGEKVAEGVFQLNGLTVNPETSKPWLFIFPKESIRKADADLSRFKVAAIEG